MPTVGYWTFFDAMAPARRIRGIGTKLPRPVLLLTTQHSPPRYPSGRYLLHLHALAFFSAIPPQKTLRFRAQRLPEPVSKTPPRNVLCTAQSSASQ